MRAANSASTEALNAALLPSAFVPYSRAAAKSMIVSIRSRDTPSSTASFT
jgi:hypothetical protein